MTPQDPRHNEELLSQMEVALMEKEKELERLKTELELLKKRCQLECFERRRLHNEMIALKGNIRAFCRCRPLNAVEVARGELNVVSYSCVLDDELKVEDKVFRFDHVFKPEDTQDAVFEQTSPLVVSVLDGFNVCIFAYGQTGTGKTFTMEGPANNRGVINRTLEELFRVSEERSDIMKYEFSVSMVEVYKETIKDLLGKDSKKLKVLLTEVPDVTEWRVNNTGDVSMLLERGTSGRSIGSTLLNEYSSRSHLLLRVTVVGKNLVDGQSTESRLWLVDLAGTENAAKTGAEGERLDEANAINKSLLALRQVISALIKKGNPSYRNSKLTLLLKNSMGGDCKTLMFVHISPSPAHLSETIYTLKFAQDARSCEHGPALKQLKSPNTKQQKQDRKNSYSPNRTRFRFSKLTLQALKSKNGTQRTLIDKERKTKKGVAMASPHPLNELRSVQATGRFKDGKEPIK